MDQPLGSANDNSPPELPNPPDPFVGGETLRLWMGDCLKEMRRIPDRSVHLILCDLPYGTTACTWDVVIPFDALWAEYRRIITPTGVIVLTGSQPFSAMLVASNPEWFRYALVWKKTRKTGFLHAKNKPLKEHEDILVFSPAGAVHPHQSKRRMTYNPQGVVELETPVPSRNGRGSKSFGGKIHIPQMEGRKQTHTNFPTSVLEFPSVAKTVHSAQKPQDLCEYLIRTYSNPREVVLDNCMGSGTAGLAAVATGRKFIGIEREPEHFATAMGRIAEMYSAQHRDVSSEPPCSPVSANDVVPEAANDDRPVRVIHGDSLLELRKLPDNSIDSVVCDPPYGLDFMGKAWDSPETIAFRPDVWREVLRVLKPGGHLLAFGGTRTYHRMVVAIEDAGFEIRDQLGWLYGQGFPKSRNIGKDIDRKLGSEREIVGKRKATGYTKLKAVHGVQNVNTWEFAQVSDEPATPEAANFNGWGTALKPSWEPIVMARKPLVGAVAANVLEWGVGGLNIDACRVGTETVTTRIATRVGGGGQAFGQGGVGKSVVGKSHEGRWPANVIHDGSDAVVELFPTTKAGSRTACVKPLKRTDNNVFGSGLGTHDESNTYDDGGSAARYFYCAKASAEDRAGSKHPTVKPIALMRHLVKLVTPPGGTVLDPFAGSGTTGQAAIEEGFGAILIEREAEYVADIHRRLGMAA